MTFKSKSPPKGLTRSKPLQSKASMKSGRGIQAAPLSLAEQRKTQQKALQKATLRALAKAREAAESQNIPLSEWENDFIDGVAERVKTYGRAFADPDKGALNGTLSMRQGIILREIRRKAEGKGGSDKRKSRD